MHHTCYGIGFSDTLYSFWGVPGTLIKNILFRHIVRGTALGYSADFNTFGNKPFRIVASVNFRCVIAHFHCIAF